MRLYICLNCSLRKQFTGDKGREGAVMRYKLFLGIKID